MLKTNKHLNYLILFLVLLGSSLFFYKHSVLKVPLKQESTTKRWTVEAKLSFLAKRQAVKLQVSIPEQQPHFFQVKENFISANYGILTKNIDGGRYAIWTAPYATGQQTLYYRLELTPKEPEKIKIQLQKQKFKNEEPEITAIDTILAEAKKKSADATSLASQVVILLNDPNNQNTSLLLQDDHTEHHIATIASQILSRANIPATVIQGLLLQEHSSGDFVSWLALSSDNSTTFINPTTGEESLPKSFLIWHVGNTPLYTIKGGKNVSLKLSKTSKFSKPIISTDSKSLLLEFSLDTLPLRVQSIYHILLTIPFGAIIILFFRNYIGLPTFGTFMPVLIALALIHMNIAWGVFLFSLITVFGLGVRFYLEQLHLLIVPRLSAILVCIVLFIAFLGVITHKLGIDQGVSAAMFPMVILTMTIERMCTLWDEQGPLSAIKNGLGSLFVAALSSLIMANQNLQFLVFHFPELNLITLAFILIMGQYRGYRLTELSRFKVLAE